MHLSSIGYLYLQVYFIPGGDVPSNYKLGICLSLHSTTRIPVDDSYVAVLGKAVYVFAYYEWAIIWIIERLQAGFVHRYVREKTMTSGQVKDALQALISDPSTIFAKVSKRELENCCAEFGRLIIKRNALIHAHPITAPDGSQILAYQTNMTKPLPDMKWPKPEVEAVVAEFDNAASSVSGLLEKLRK